MVMTMTGIEVLSTYDDDDPEICEILIGQQSVFTSSPPRGLLRPIPVRQVPWDCEDDSSKQTQTSYILSRVGQNSSKPEVTVSDEVNGVHELQGGSDDSVDVQLERNGHLGEGENVAQLSSENPTAKQLVFHHHTVVTKPKKSRSLFDVFRQLFRRFRS